MAFAAERNPGGQAGVCIISVTVSPVAHLPSNSLFLNPQGPLTLESQMHFDEEGSWHKMAPVHSPNPPFLSRCLLGMVPGKC